MAKGVAFTDQAEADLRAIPQPVAIQILRTLPRFVESAEGNVKRLKGVEPPLYRLRTQDHRVMFRDLGTHIEIIRVRNRREAYRRR
jgi:mRNA-degrading endonuclease RelE of RelBE toxin-antitoxin system